MAAVRPRGEAGGEDGPIRPPAEVGDGRAVRQRVDEPVRLSTPSSSSQQAQVRVAEVEEFTPCEPCGPEEFEDEDCGARVVASPAKPTQ